MALGPPTIGNRGLGVTALGSLVIVLLGSDSWPLLGQRLPPTWPPPRQISAAAAMDSGIVSPSGTTADRRVRIVLARVRPKPELVAQVVSPIWGRVEFAEQPLAVGETVRTGQPLLRLVLELSADERYPMEVLSEQLRSAVEVAKTRKQQRELEYRRAIALLKAEPANPFRRQEVESAERLFEAASEEQDVLERQQRVFTRIVMRRRDPRVTVVEAPISGVITELDVRPGQLIATDEFRKLCTIVDLSRVWIEADVYERDIGDILLNSAAASYALAESGDWRPLGRPVAVLPWIDEKTRTAKIIYELANPARQLRLGMTVHVSYEVTGPTDRLDPGTAQTS